MLNNQIDKVFELETIWIFTLVNELYSVQWGERQTGINQFHVR